MTLNVISNLIKTTCVQLTQNLLMNALMKYFLPSLLNLFKFINSIGIVKILIYLLFISVLLFIIIKLFKFLKKIFRKNNQHSNLSIIKNLKKNNFSKSTNYISSFDSKSSDYNLEPKKKINQNLARLNSGLNSGLNSTSKSFSSLESSLLSKSSEHSKSTNKNKKANKKANKKENNKANKDKVKSESLLSSTF